MKSKEIEGGKSNQKKNRGVAMHRKLGESCGSQKNENVKIKKMYKLKSKILGKRKRSAILRSGADAVGIDDDGGRAPAARSKEKGPIH